MTDLQECLDTAVIAVDDYHFAQLAASQRISRECCELIGAQSRPTGRDDGEQMAYLPVRGIIRALGHLATQQVAGGAAELISTIFHGSLAQEVQAFPNPGAAVGAIMEGPDASTKACGIVALQAYEGFAALLVLSEASGVLPQTEDVQRFKSVLANAGVYDLNTQTVNVERSGGLLDMHRALATAPQFMVAM